MRINYMTYFHCKNVQKPKEDLVEKKNIDVRWWNLKKQSVPILSIAKKCTTLLYGMCLCCFRHPFHPLDIACSFFRLFSHTQHAYTHTVSDFIECEKCELAEHCCCVPLPLPTELYIRTYIRCLYVSWMLYIKCYEDRTHRFGHKLRDTFATVVLTWVNRTKCENVVLFLVLYCLHHLPYMLSFNPSTHCLAQKPSPFTYTMCTLQVFWNDFNFDANNK